MNIIILHAWKNTPKDHWYQWCKNKLSEKNYDVRLPKLPTMEIDIPDPDKMMSHLLLDVGINKESIIIGHSLGCLLALRIAERMMYKTMILVAPWDFNDLTPQHKLFWKKPIDHNVIERNTKERFCITSDNDPYITAFQVEQMAKRLNAKYQLIKNAGHFTTQFGITKIPELLNII